MEIQRVTVDAKDLVPPKKAADYLGISKMTLSRWVRAGKITPVMLDHRYFHINELNRVRALLEQKEQRASDGSAE